MLLSHFLNNLLEVNLKIIYYYWIGCGKNHEKSEWWHKARSDQMYDINLRQGTYSCY